MSLPCTKDKIFKKDSGASPSNASNAPERTSTVSPECLSKFVDTAVLESEMTSKRCCGKFNDDRTSTKRSHLAKILLFTLVPIVILSVITCVSMIENIPEFETRNIIRRGIHISLEIGKVVHHIQIERGTSLLFASTKSNPSILNMLHENYQKTNVAIENLSVWPVVSDEDPPYFKSKKAYFTRIQEYRRRVIANNVTRRDITRLYTDDNAVIIRWVAKCATLSMSDQLWRPMVAYHMLLLAKDAIGVERAHGSSFYVEGNYSRFDLAWYIRNYKAGATYLNISSQYSKQMAKLLSDKFGGSELMRRLSGMRRQIFTYTVPVSVTAALWWFDNMTLYIDKLKEIQDTSGKGILAELASELDALNHTYSVSIGLLVGAICLYPTILMVVFKLTKQIQAVALSMKEQALLLAKERKRSEALLYQMLPISVAKKLMRNERVEPKLYASATVLFSDIVGFTHICSTCTPFEVVNLLNQLYKAYDAKLEKYDVYKVETIGDCYMVVSGIPEANGDRHVSEISFLAFDLLETTSQIKLYHLPRKDVSLTVRVGLNTGPVVSGIVGKKMPRYCLFGDTVNVASRMESTGKLEPCDLCLVELPKKLESHDLTNHVTSITTAQHIHITFATAKALMKYPCFRPVERGLIEIKGKGNMLTYWLNRPYYQRGFHDNNTLTLQMTSHQQLWL